MVLSPGFQTTWNVGKQGVHRGKQIGLDDDDEASQYVSCRLNSRLKGSSGALLNWIGGLCVEVSWSSSSGENTQFLSAVSTRIGA